MSVYRTSVPLVCFKCVLTDKCVRSELHLHRIQNGKSKQLIAKPWPIVQQENVDAKQQFAGNYCIYLKQKLYNIGNILPRVTPTYLHINIYLSTALISHVVERPLR